MRILYVITKADRGGAQVHLLDLLSSLPPGYEPVIATGEKGFLTEQAAKLGVRVRLIRDLVQPIAPLRDLRALLSLMKVIKQEEPDLIHVHTSKAALLGRLGALLTGRPSVFTAHTWSFSDGIPWIQKCISLPLEQLAAFACKKIINVSQANVAMAKRKAIGRGDRLVCIWNGIPDVTLRARPGSGQVTTLLMTARFVPQKNHMSFIEAMAGVTGDWRVLLVGDGPTRKPVEETVVRLGIADRVVFAGERKDVAELLAAADIFVLSSNWEGLPLSILEAMRAALPVVATAVGGVAEAVDDGVTGFLVPPQSPETLRDRLQTLVSSRRLQQQMGLHGRLRYDRDFRIEAMVRKTLAVYNEVLLRPQIRLGDAVVKRQEPS
jgi:glycosyltransferase involved in cell wall biosynthesis